MDRKQRLNNKSAADSKSNGYQQNSRGDGKKNSNKDEESYYEGTSKVKRERQRKPRASTSTQSLLSSGFTQSANTGPPPMNAWTQKKGSALFVKPEEEFAVDEEDYMLKQALEESIRTAENEKKTRAMLNRYDYGEGSSYESIVDKRVQWGNKPEEKKLCSFDKEIKKPDLSFMNKADRSDSKNCTENAYKNSLSNSTMPEKTKKGEESAYGALSKKNHNTLKEPIESTDSEDYPNNNRNQQQNVSRPRKSFSPPEKVPQPNYKPPNDTKSRSEIYQSDQSSEYSDYEDNYEPPSHEYSLNHESNRFKTSTSYNRKSVSPKPPVNNPKQEHKEKLNSISDLSKGIKSALTFEDTQGLLNDVQENDNFSFSDPKQNYSFGSSRFEPNLPNPEPTKSETSPDLAFPSSAETDELLHSFIRKDPPSNLANQLQMADFERSSVFPGVGGNQFLQSGPLHQNYLVGDGNFHPGLAKANDLDSPSPLSNSPSQNTPFGSFENQILPGMASNMQFQPGQLPYQYPLNFLPTNGSNLQNPLANQHFLSQMGPYSNVPGYGLSNMTNPLLAQMAAANQNMIPPLNDSRNNLSMLQSMNQNVAGLAKPTADTKMTSVGNTVPSQNLAPSLSESVQNPVSNTTLGNQTTNSNLASSIGNVANKPDLMSLLGANNPPLDPLTLAALNSQAALLNMVPKVDQTAAQLYQAQMLANYNYYQRLQYQAQMAALSGNAEANEDSGADPLQPAFPFVNQSQALPKAAPQQQFPPENPALTAMENQMKALRQASLQNQVQPNQEQMSQPNSFFSDFNTQVNLMNQAQATKEAEIKLQMQLLAKQYTSLEQSLQNKGDTKVTPTPMSVPGQASVPTPPVMMPPQSYMYPAGQFVPAPVMGLQSYFPMMPGQNTSQTSPNTQPNSQLYNLPSDNESSRLQQ